MEQDSTLSRVVADASWSKFVSMLEYKGKWYGRDIIKVPTFLSKQSVMLDLWIPK